MNVLKLVIRKTYDQDLAHSLDTPKNISVKVISQAVITNTCGKWHSLFTVTSIRSIQKPTRNLQICFAGNLQICLHSPKTSTKEILTSHELCQRLTHFWQMFLPYSLRTPENQRCFFCCPRGDIMEPLAIYALDKTISKDREKSSW